MNVFAISHRGIASHPFRSARFNTRPGVCCLRAEGPRVTREYREDDDTVTNAPTSKPTSDPNSVYVDELPEVPRTEMSQAMKERLRREYYSLGGSPNRATGGNWFLYIILIISALAIMSAVLGYI